jgi:hypothetical protein
MILYYYYYYRTLRPTLGKLLRKKVSDKGSYFRTKQLPMYLEELVHRSFFFFLITIYQQFRVSRYSHCADYRCRDTIGSGDGETNREGKQHMGAARDNTSMDRQGGDRSIGSSLGRRRLHVLFCLSRHTCLTMRQENMLLDGAAEDDVRDFFIGSCATELLRCSWESAHVHESGRQAGCLLSTYAIFQRKAHRH